MVRHKKEYFKKQKLAYDLPQEQDTSREILTSDREEDDPSMEGGDLIEISTMPRNSAEIGSFNASFCSFVQTVPGSDSRKGEKFSYLVAQKRIYGREDKVESSFGEKDNLASLLTMAQTAAAQEDAGKMDQVFEQVQNLESRYMGRIIRAPIKKKGHVYIDYCAAPGRIIRSRVAKSSAYVAPGLWNAARKSRWGGFWPDTMDTNPFSNK
jgi:ribosomal protein RSM22 (predicted rRNA methylase)